MTKLESNDKQNGRDRPVEFKITEGMTEAGLSALERWADRYGVEDVPAERQLISAVLQAAQVAQRQGQ